MPNYALTRNERVYPFMQTTFGTATALTGSQACRIVKFSANNQVPIMTRPDKTGSRSLEQGIPGRRVGQWEVDMSLAANGAPGVVPDCDMFLQLLFGQAATVVASTSCTYAINDNILQGTVYDYRQPSTLSQRVAHTMIAADGKFSLGKDFADFSASGQNLWTLGTEEVSTADASMKGGLSSIPSEPGSPVTNGAPVVGFVGSATLDGNLVAEIQSATIDFKTGNEMVLDTFGSYYATSAMGGFREVTLDFTVYDSDAAYLNDLKNKGVTKAPIVVTLVVGNVAGNTWTFTMNNVMLGTQNYEEPGDRYTVQFNGCRCYATTLTSKDELSLLID